MLFLRGKSTAVSEKEGMQLKDEHDVVVVEDHGEPPRGASPLSPGMPTKVRHSSALDSQLPATQMRGSSDDVPFLEDAASCHDDALSTRDLTSNTIPVHLTLSLTSMNETPLCVWWDGGEKVGYSLFQQLVLLSHFTFIVN